MAQKLDLKIKGLYTNPNEFSEVPEGALLVADNIVIDKESIAESRRGHQTYGDALTVPVDSFINKLFSYKNSLITHYDSKLAYDSDGAGTWVDYSGTYAAPDDNFKVQGTRANRNFYFTTSEGIYKLDSVTSTPRSAGAPKGLNGVGAVDGSSGFMADDTAVAYRIVWGYKDLNNNLIIGAPSQRLVVSNSSGGTRNVSLTFTVPTGITTSYLYQIYRSGESASASTEPNDELQLVLEGNLTSAEITALEFTVVDNTPDDLKGAFLYTSPSQEGISQANEPPPYAKDIGVFKDYTMYSNTKSKHRITFNILAVDSPSFGYVSDSGVTTTDTSTDLTDVADTTNLRVGMRVVGVGIPTDTYIASIGGSPIAVTMTNAATVSDTNVTIEFQDRFTVNLMDYWGGSATDQSSNTFKVFTTGTPASNIDNTSLELIEVINQDSGNTTVYAYYLSGYNDLPGQILIEERTVGGAQFYLTSTYGQSFAPALPERNTITSISIADPTVITSVDHQLTTGDNITIYDTNSVPVISGEYSVTVLTTDTFTIPVEVTTIGSSGYFVLTEELVASDNDEKENRIYISKFKQPEAVPILQYLDVGSADAPIDRTVALRDSMFVFKTDGIYRITGEDITNFRVNLFDNTTTINVKESARPFNNQVFCFSDQGIISVSDNGVQIVSRPIESTLLELSSDLYPAFKNVSFGVSYESARQYIFFTVTNKTDTYPTQAFVYNSLTTSWTRWVLSRTCAIINPVDNKMYSGHPLNDYVYQERKNYDLTDYADEQYAVTIVSSDEFDVTLSSVTNVEVGMSLRQGLRTSKITAIDGVVVTVANDLNWEAGSADVYTPIENILTFVKFDAENPGIVKQFREYTLVFRSAQFNELLVGVSTNFSNTNTYTTLTPRGTNTWGTFPWGSGLWGGGLGGAQTLRTYVPRNKQRAHWLTMTIENEQAFTSFSLAGVSLILDGVSERFRGNNGQAS